MAGGLAVLAVLVSAAVWSAAAAQQPATAEEENPPGVGIKVSLRPSVAIVVGIFTMIFSLTFILLMYAKFCHPSSSSSPLPATLATTQQQQQQEQEQILSKAVIESLPFFRFATLRGARQGMECAVCLSRFDDADVLRLLPRCRHAFHLDCVDRWLHSNASCPLCRSPIHADDATLGLKYAASARIVFGGDDDDLSSSGRDLLDIFVERVPSSRFPHQQQQEELDRHRHRIIVSDAVFKSRWSELSSSDLTEILSSFPSPPEPSSSPQQTTTTEKNRLLGLATTANNNLRASLSEIVSLPRLLAPPATSEDENRRWLPIARRTARRFAGRANKQEEDDQEAAVHVAAALGSGVTV